VRRKRQIVVAGILDTKGVDHRGVGPYGPEAESQDVPSDNGLYHPAFIQTSRYVFGAEERIALPFCFKRCSDLSCHSIASYTAQNERLRYAWFRLAGWSEGYDFKGRLRSRFNFEIIT